MFDKPTKYILEFPQIYPQTPYYYRFLINNFQKMPKIPTK